MRVMTCFDCNFFNIISKKESQRFLKCVQNLRKLKPEDLKGLNVEILPKMRKRIKNGKSIF